MSVRIPEFLWQMLLGQYGEDTAARILDGYGRKRPVTLRVNTLKADVDTVRESLAKAGIAWQQVTWNPDAMILREVREPEVRSLDIYERGQIYLQSLSSMIPPVLLEPKPGECILDMAAAPGGKTTQMAAMTGGKAQITACEKNFARAERLRYNLEKQGAAGVLVMNEDARKLDPFFSFDKILLDAPCSGSGTLRIPGGEAGTSSVSLKEAGGITEELISRSARTQEALLKKALELLKPGHVMIYSTCSVLRDENERVLARVLPKMKARIVPLGLPAISAEEFSDGGSSADETPADETPADEIPRLPVELAGTLCVCPTELYEGFFIAKIQKMPTVRLQFG